MAWQKYGADDLPIYFDSDTVDRSLMRPSDWEEGVRKALDNLWKVPPYQTSRAVINGIKRSKQRVLILPRTGRQITGSWPVQLQSYDWTPDYIVKSDQAAATPAGQRVLDGQGHMVLDPSDNPFITPLMGTGLGSGALIRFTPQEFRGSTAPGASPDEGLLHELTHALQMVSGRTAVQVLQPRAFLRFDNICDLLAVTIANIYRSEQGSRPDLRADHQGFRPLSARFADSREFYLLFPDEFDQLQGWLPFLFAHVAHVRCRFNPIRYQLECKLNTINDRDLATYGSQMDQLEATAPAGAQ